MSDTRYLCPDRSVRSKRTFIILLDIIVTLLATYEQFFFTYIGTINTEFL